MGNQVQIIFDKSQISILKPKRCARCGAKLNKIRWGTNPVTGEIEHICKKCFAQEKWQLFE